MSTPAATVTGLAGRRPALRDVDDEQLPAPVALRLTRAELLDRSGLVDAVLTELEQQGLIRPHGDCYDEDALLVARAAGQLAGYGIEPRHLRGYQAAASPRDRSAQPVGGATGPPAHAGRPGQGRPDRPRSLRARRPTARRAGPDRAAGDPRRVSIAAVVGGLPGR